MTEVQKRIQALDPELYVKKLPEWSREREAARNAGKKVVAFPISCPEVPQKPQPPQDKPKKKRKQEPDRADPTLVFSVLLAAFGMFCLVVALIV